MKKNALPKLTKHSDEMKTLQLVNSLADELDKDMRKVGGSGILPLPGFSQKYYGVKLSEALRRVCEPILETSNDDIATTKIADYTFSQAFLEEQSR